MEKIITAISNLEDMRFIKPATIEQVEKAQKDLGVSFANDYKEYLLTYGVISARGIELTGVSTVERLDVVKVTKRERAIIEKMPLDVYVIENTAIDGIVILQKPDGTIYSITMDGKIEYVCASLTEYVECSNF